MNTAQTVDALLTLVERSGLLAADQLSPYRALAADPTEVARALVRDRLLTPFQARQLLRGKFRGYFLTDKYKVLDELGAGGGGRVLLCEHLLLQKLVALKLLSASWANVPGTAERFLREARAAAAVDHPNIVRVFDVDKTGTVPFMVMEFVDGTNFHQLVAEHGPLSAPRAAHYIRQAALGLEGARAGGLVHRDIKPANLLLDRSGQVRLTDLGLARFLGNAMRNHNLTQQFDPNSVLGTLDFIAPEQADNSSAVDIRADIYSLGYTLYYLLTGKMPFGDGSAAQKLMWHQLRHPEPISSMRREVPAELETVFRRMTEKSPADRYQTPTEVADALLPLVGEPIPPPSPQEMPKFQATTYQLGLSPPPTPDVLATPPTSTAPPTPSPTDTPAADRPPAKGSPPPVPWRAPKPPKSGSHVLASLPAARSSALPGDPPSKSGTDSTAAPPPRRVRWPYYAGLAAVLLAIGIGVVASRPGGKGNPTPVLPPPPPNGQPDRGPETKKPPEPRVTPKAGPTDPVPPPGATAGSSFALTGAGSSFVAPMMDRWAREYKQRTGKTLGYTQSNSVKGMEALLEKRRVAFACSDTFLDDKQTLEAENAGGVVYVPLVMGAVVAAYNLPPAAKPLRLTGDQLARIYLGEIARWNDPALAISNPGAGLPDLPIRVVHRSERSGTTFIWTDYLSNVSPDWKNKVKPSADTIVKWPAGQGAEGNDGVADAVSNTPGALGYVELGYAMKKGLPYAEVKNEAEEWVKPSPESITAAAGWCLTNGKIPDDLRFTLTNARSKGSYPICSATWAVLYKKQPGKDRKELLDFLRWAVSKDGQEYVTKAERHYAPLPAALAPKIDAVLKTVAP
jgi:phosphate ABC transporter phosphate-binding protein